MCPLWQYSLHSLFVKNADFRINSCTMVAKTKIIVLLSCIIYLSKWTFLVSVNCFNIQYYILQVFLRQHILWHDGQSERDGGSLIHLREIVCFVSWIYQYLCVCVRYYHKHIQHHCVDKKSHAYSCEYNFIMASCVRYYNHVILCAIFNAFLLYVPGCKQNTRKEQ